LYTRLLAAIFGSAIWAASSASTYYVRADGGTAEQCRGTQNTAFTQTTNGACAWRHPFEALPPGGRARIGSGDTLVIAGGSYQMGVGAPGSDGFGPCKPDQAWDCHAAAVPPGTAPDRPTRILGEGYDRGCASPPQLWGSERAASVLDLTRSSNVEIACVEITDHADCIEFHNGTPRAACEREHAPFGPWAAVGIAAADAANVTLRDVNIHGLAHDGIRAGRLRDWTLERVRIVGNGWSGWNGDIGGNSSNAGKMIFRDVEIAWNGCAEKFPGGEHTGCWGQQRGGYGDGLGTGETGGDWVFERVDAHHNTQDGIDLLHANAQASVTFRDVRAQANAGNQLKASGTVTVQHSNVTGTCSALVEHSDLDQDDACRARGNTLSLHVAPAARIEVAGNTLEGEGDCLIDLGCSGRNCGDSRVKIVHNILHGAPGKNSPDRLPCAAWVDPNLHGAQLEFDNEHVEGTRGSRCPEGFTRCGAHH
jgi:hypothetical protein